jgi:hypothetical protein
MISSCQLSVRTSLIVRPIKSAASAMSSGVRRLAELAGLGGLGWGVTAAYNQPDETYGGCLGVLNVPLGLPLSSPRQD